MSNLTAADCVYTPYFCEENSYKLCEQLVQRPFDVYVAFISNRNRQVGSRPADPCFYAACDSLCTCLQIPLWRQRASRQPSGLVVWDYHVLVLQRTGTDCLVWDLDT